MAFSKQSNSWKSSLPHFFLDTNKAHVWKADLSLDSDKVFGCYELLCADEQARAKKFRFLKDKIHFIAARGILRKLLGQYLGKPPEEIIFEYGKNGKPSIQHFSTLQFNVSHSKGIGLFGFVEEFPLGIDVEWVQPGIEFDVLIPRFFSKAEAQCFLHLDQTQIPIAFFNCWTRKEAFIKAKGDGLSFPLQEFEVSLLPGERPELKSTHWDPLEKDLWSLFGFEVSENYVGALAIEGKLDEIDFYEWKF